MKLSMDIVKKLPHFSLNVQFDLDRESIGILGPSGSGKSMVLKCIAGIEKPDQGRIVLNSRVLFDSERSINLSPEQRRVGYLFQNYALFPHMTVAGNIEIALSNSWNRKKRVHELIEKFHLQGLEEAYPLRLSGGEQQRVALARMLATEPEMILLDEPFSALDGILREQMQQKLPCLLQGSNYLMVTHDMDEAYRLSEKILVLEGGKMLAFGPGKAFRSSPKPGSGQDPGSAECQRGHPDPGEYDHGTSMGVPAGMQGQAKGIPCGNPVPACAHFFQPWCQQLWVRNCHDPGGSVYSHCVFPAAPEPDQGAALTGHCG